MPKMDFVNQTAEVVKPNQPAIFRMDGNLVTVTEKGPKTKDKNLQAWLDDAWENEVTPPGWNLVTEFVIRLVSENPRSFEVVQVPGPKPHKEVEGRVY